MRSPTEPVVGWRYWRFDPGLARLTSVSQRGFTWDPGTALGARCVGGDHAAPDPGCSCGIHASADLGSLRQHALCLAPGVLVVGEVGLWGRVVLDDHGYRAEVAAPRRLWLVAATGYEPEGAASAVDGRRDGIGPSHTSLLGALRAYGCPVAVMAGNEAFGDATAATMAFLAMSGPGG